MDVSKMVAATLQRLDKENPEAAEMLRARLKKRMHGHVPGDSQSAPSTDGVRTLAIEAEVRTIAAQLGDLAKWLVDRDMALRKELAAVKESVDLLLDVTSVQTTKHALPAAAKGDGKGEQ